MRLVRFVCSLGRMNDQRWRTKPGLIISMLWQDSGRGMWFLLEEVRFCSESSLRRYLTDVRLKQFTNPSGIASWRRKLLKMKFRYDSWLKYCIQSRSVSQSPLRGKKLFKFMPTKTNHDCNGSIDHRLIGVNAHDISQPRRCWNQGNSHEPCNALVILRSWTPIRFYSLRSDLQLG